jgi:hypothetical protein
LLKFLISPPIQVDNQEWRIAAAGPAMTELNPLAGAILSSTQTQRQLAADKGRQLRRAQVAQKDASAQSDQLDHQVESPDIVALIGDDARERQEPEKHPARRPLQDETSEVTDDDSSHIDVTG